MKSFHLITLYLEETGRGGGVFLACKNTTVCKHIELDTDCEVVACEIKLSNRSPLIIAALYRPPYNDIEYMENLCDSLNRIITTYNNPTIWLAGDLNLPNIDCPTILSMEIIIRCLSVMYFLTS